MAGKDYKLLDLGIDEELDPKIEINSLISVTVSTVMCLAAKCPLPKSNVEATKRFLSTIVDENGENPRNIKAFLVLLNDYKGPYEYDFQEEKIEEVKYSEGVVAISNGPDTIGKEGASTDGQILIKRSSKIITKREDQGRKHRNSAKISPSKSAISSKIEDRLKPTFF